MADDKSQKPKEELNELDDAWADAFSESQENETGAVEEPEVHHAQFENFETPAGIAQQDVSTRKLGMLLDVMLPKMSGLDVCREVRKTSAVPIIMVSAKGSEIDAVLGLEMGADDYVTKPYRLRELVARMRAVLRRQGGAPAESVVEDDQTIEVSGIVLDLGRHEVRVGGAPVHLPLKEFELLEHLMDNAGRVVPRGSLIDVVWGHDYVGDTKTLDVHIKRLRKRLGEQGSNELITTVRGVGYRFERSG